MNIYVKRDVTIYDLPIGGRVKILHPESIVICINGSSTLDIGALCYLDRSEEYRGSYQKARLVNLESFDQERSDRIRELIEYISDQKSLGLRRHTTLNAVVRSWARFIDWCDANGNSAVLTKKQANHLAFRSYILYLADQVQNGSLHCNTAANYQNYTLEIFTEFIGDIDVAVGVKLIYKTSMLKQETLVPDERSQSHVLSLCDCLYNGLQSLVVFNQKYPFRIDMPQYLNWKDNYIYVFPTPKWSMAPHVLKIRDTLKYPCWGYDYKYGKISSLDEIEQYYPYKCFAQTAIDTAKRKINDANCNVRHNRRLKAAMLAHNLFLVMFIANTGMNEAQVINLRWSDDYEVDAKTQGFREIKYRASNKIVSFQIGIEFLATFKKFIALRKYILNDEVFTDYLFISLGANRQFSPGRVTKSTIDNVYISLRNIDPELPKIMTRAWRVAKSDFLIRNTDLSTTAIILQNSEKTVAKHYAQGSESLGFDELSKFYEGISHIVKQSEEGIGKNVSKNAVGGCIDYGNPGTGDSAVIEPDCHQMEGCLFCDKYIIHADEVDVRKLLSCKYCINKTSHLSDSIEHFKSIYGGVVDRIDVFLEYISKLSDENSEMVKRISEEVMEDGDLDSYWSRKIEMLIHLGIVSV